MCALSSHLHVSSLAYKLTHSWASRNCVTAKVQIQHHRCCMVSRAPPRSHSQEGTSHTSNEWALFPPTSLSFSHVWEHHSQPRAQAALRYRHPLCCSLCPQRSIWMLSRAHHFPALQFTEYQTFFLPAQLNHSSLPWSSSPASITVTPSYLASNSHMFSSLPACSNHSC